MHRGRSQRPAPARTPVESTLPRSRRRRPSTRAEPSTASSLHRWQRRPEDRQRRRRGRIASIPPATTSALRPQPPNEGIGTERRTPSGRAGWELDMAPQGIRGNPSRSTLSENTRPTNECGMSDTPGGLDNSIGGTDSAELNGRRRPRSRRHRREIRYEALSTLSCCCSSHTTAASSASSWVFALELVPLWRISSMVPAAYTSNTQGCT